MRKIILPGRSTSHRLYVLDGWDIINTYVDIEQLTLIWPGIWVDLSCLDRPKLYDLCGPEQFDWACPIDWVRREYVNKGKVAPLLVWSYEVNKNFGSPVYDKDVWAKLIKRLRLEVLYLNEKQETASDLQEEADAARALIKGERV